MVENMAMARGTTWSLVMVTPRRESAPRMSVTVEPDRETPGRAALVKSALVRSQPSNRVVVSFASRSSRRRCR
jgi:hypothetical protein